MKKDLEGRMPLADLLVFHQLSRSLASSADRDSILRTILEHMEQTVGAELWTLLLLDDATQQLYYAIAAGGKQDALRSLRVKLGEGVAGWVAEHGETLIVPEAAHDPRLESVAPARSSVVSSVIALPLRGRKGTRGVIEIYNPRADHLTDTSIAFLHILADHAAIAIENADDMERGQQVSLAFIDLDRFKLVNDAHGHLMGSELLAKVGQRLQELSRPQDVCFRYGGDEFVVLMPGITAHEALLLAQNQLRRLMNTPFRMKNGLQLSVSASVGLSTAPADGRDLHAIIGSADARMYRVKNDGRGKVLGS
jgi:diguanylate cyclase (GGDEF)-like protein